MTSHQHASVLVAVSTDDPHPYSDARQPVAPHTTRRGYRRLTLVGMGLAGGLVPSPSALVVLLGAIGLGRTAFGVLLVLGYGLGMAVTLTAVGYVIARLPDRFHKLKTWGRHSRMARIARLGPVLTAILVLVVGIGLAVRSAGPLV